ncbi:MAG: hypothetical protein R2795_04100 [Saprospiraceae bacterium]
MRWWSILLLGFIVSNGNLHGQSDVSLLLNGADTPGFRYYFPLVSTTCSTPIDDFTPLARPRDFVHLPYLELAFFCRVEVKMEKAARIPVLFRLGDVPYVDKLEGKREAWRYGW